MFVIKDESHAEQLGEYATLEAALVELKRLSTIPWDKEPNQAPCISWKTCGREYEIYEYDTSTTPWTGIRNFSVMKIDAKGVTWEPEFAPK